MSKEPSHSLAKAVFSNLLGKDHEAVEPLASGENRFDLISDRLDDPDREVATKLFHQLEDAQYWNPERKEK